MMKADLPYGWFDSTVGSTVDGINSGAIHLVVVMTALMFKINFFHEIYNNIKQII